MVGNGEEMELVNSSGSVVVANRQPGIHTGQQHGEHNGAGIA